MLRGNGGITLKASKAAAAGMLDMLQPGPYLGVVCVIPRAVSAILRLEVTFRKGSGRRGFVKAGGSALFNGKQSACLLSTMCAIR